MPQLYNFRPPARMETSGIVFLTREWGNLRSVDLYYPQVFDIAFGYHDGCSTPGDLVVCPADNLDIVRSSGGFGPTYVLDLVYYPGGSGDLRNIKRNDIFFIANKENSGDPKPYNLYRYKIFQIYGTPASGSATVGVEYVSDSSGIGNSDPADHYLDCTYDGYGYTLYCGRVLSISREVNTSFLSDL